MSAIFVWLNIFRSCIRPTPRTEQQKVSAALKIHSESRNTKHILSTQPTQVQMSIRPSDPCANGAILMLCAMSGNETAKNAQYHHRQSHVSAAVLPHHPSASDVNSGDFSAGCGDADGADRWTDTAAAGAAPAPVSAGSTSASAVAAAVAAAAAAAAAVTVANGGTTYCESAGLHTGHMGRQLERGAAFSTSISMRPL